MRTLTHWISPRQRSGDIYETIERVKRNTPAKWRPQVLVPALYGDIPQASPQLANDLHMDLRPKDPADLRWIADHFLDAGIPCGAWGVPRSLAWDEGYAHGSMAAVVHLYCLDIEPYEFFLDEADRDPSAFIRGFNAACSIRPWISIVPQESGLRPLGSAWHLWAQSCAGIRPQAYGSSYPSLRYPQPSMALLQAYMRAARVKRRVIPIFDWGPLMEGLLKRARADRDIWVLGD